MPGLPTVILEQAVRPIGAACRNTVVPCKVQPLTASKPSRREVYHNLSQLHPPMDKCQDSNVSWQEAFLKLVDEVENTGVDSLTGNTINLELLENKLPAAVTAGLVEQEDADYILHGLKRGFDLHVDESFMRGKRVFKNYKSAFESKDKVHDALMKRVRTGKTLRLGDFTGKVSELPGLCGCNVPQGAVPKRLEPDAARPFSDHTKTGFNNACKDDWLKHSLNTYNEIAEELKPGYFMRVEDVDGAYPVLPLSPKVWKYMYVWWFDTDLPLKDQVEPNTLYVHIFADFGTSALPGIWDKFFRCLKALAIMDGVLTLPMPHYVDDNSLIGPTQAVVDSVAVAVGEYFELYGIKFKQLKSRHAALLQLVLGFWWDSVHRTRTLESEKLCEYISHFKNMSTRRVMTLHELQIIIGRMHRAVLTMPPGSNLFLARLIALTRGLSMPWHKRRVTAGARSDIRAVIRILSTNHGRGYFDYSHLPWADDVYTDAMKNSRLAGWGWVSMCGACDFGKFGSSARHRPIDELEGDAVVRAARALGPSWARKRVKIFCDSSSFAFSLIKGRSKVERLNRLIRILHELSVRFNCILVPVWLSTHDNIGADALSRDEWDTCAAWFKNTVSRSGVSLHRCRDSSTSV